MAFPTAVMKENGALGAVNTATHLSLFSTAGGATAGTEISGGSPAYARKPVTWNGGAVDGTVTGTATFDVPSGATVAGFGMHTAVTGGTYVGGGAVTSQAFSSQGTYQLTVTVSVN